MTKNSDNLNQNGMQKILLTGGNGFIGSSMVDLLLEKNHEVVIFDRFQRQDFPWMNHNWDEDDRVSYFIGDIKDKEAVIDAVSRVDGVIHLAGLLGTAETIKSPFESVEVNIMGSLNVFEACWKFDKKCSFIDVGNISWLSTYPLTKVCAGKFALMYNKEMGTKISVCRMMNVIGKRQKHFPVKKFLPNIIVRALQNEDIDLFGGGTQSVDIIHIQDVVEILYRSLTMNHGVYDKVFEGGRGMNNLISVKDIAQKVIDMTGSKSKFNILPMRPGEPINSITVGDPETLKPLNYGLKDFVSFDEGLQDIINWYRDYYMYHLDGNVDVFNLK